MPVKRQSSALFSGDGYSEYGRQCPNKLAKQLREISLNDARHSYEASYLESNSAAGSASAESGATDSATTGPATFPEDSAEMDGVEGKYFTHLNRREFNNDLNEVEIDDRFTRIPDFIRSEPPRVSTPPPPPNLRKDNALILYSDRSERPSPNNSRPHAERRKQKVNALRKSQPGRDSDDTDSTNRMED